MLPFMPMMMPQMNPMMQMPQVPMNPMMQMMMMPQMAGMAGGGCAHPPPQPDADDDSDASTDAGDGESSDDDCFSVRSAATAGSSTSKRARGLTSARWVGGPALNRCISKRMKIRALDRFCEEVDAALLCNLSHKDVDIVFYCLSGIGPHTKVCELNAGSKKTFNRVARKAIARTQARWASSLQLNQARPIPPPPPPHPLPANYPNHLFGKPTPCRQWACLQHAGFISCLHYSW